MRIVHLIGTLAERDGGPSRVCVDMARAVALRGHDVSIHSTDFGLSSGSPIHGDGAVLDGVDIHCHKAWPGGLWRFSPDLWGAIDDVVARADIVHIHSLYLFHDWAGWRACRRHGTPYLLRPHGSMDPYIWNRRRSRKAVVEWLFMNRVLREAAALHYTTVEEERLARPVAQGTPGVVIPNGVRLDDFSDVPRDGRFRNLFGSSEPIRLVLFLGRLNFKKGLDLLADAFARLAERDPAARLLIVGPDGGMEQPTRERLNALGVADKVRFTGLLRGEDLHAAYGDSDLFVLPSYSENFGNAVAEAMATGTPVLISDQVNLCGEVEAAGAGRVVPCEVDQITDAMAEMIADPSELAKRSAAAKELARTFRWENIALRLEETYTILAEQPGTSADIATGTSG
jgi:glycosyltransferase involved in cell wall biosynthesis